MKNIIATAFLFAIIFSVNAQETKNPDQNPNYQSSLDKFKDSVNEYSVLQGTTKQETYKAIDPLEEKRELKSLRRQHRANRPLYRHERNLARINNTSYIQSDYGSSYGNYGYNRGFNNSFFNSNNLLTLGLLGCILWD